MFQDELSHIAAKRQCRNPDVAGCLPHSTQRALCQLLQASNYADDTSRNAWEFAVTIGELLRGGVTENELRWLVCRDYIEHAEEVTSTGKERAFDHHVSLRFCKRSAFVITAAGVAFSREFLKGFTQSEVRDDVEANSYDATLQRTRLQSVENAHQISDGNAHPQWDRDRRELRLGGKIVKVFKLPSPMQEAILMAFEEEHWPPRIDDPLPGHPDYPPKRRLHDTIKSLNRNQKNCLIRFMGDGTGEGIRWELIPSRDVAEYSNLMLQ
jgi:hypothetical protein